MIDPRILRPDRLRRTPSQFSWVDQRLVRDRLLQSCEAQAWALYLLLVTVGNAQGVSWYGDAAIARLLNLSPAAIAEARQQLQAADMIAFSTTPSLYQVLDLNGWQKQLPMASRPGPGPGPDGPVSLGDILSRLRGQS